MSRTLCHCQKNRSPINPQNKKKNQTSLSSPRAVFRCGCVCMKVDLVIMLITVQCLLFECFKPIHLSFSPVQLFSSLFMCRKPLS